MDDGKRSLVTATSPQGLSDAEELYQPSRFDGLGFETTDDLDAPSPFVGQKGAAGQDPL